MDLCEQAKKKETRPAEVNKVREAFVRATRYKSTRIRMTLQSANVA